MISYHFMADMMKQLGQVAEMYPAHVYINCIVACDCQFCGISSASWTLVVLQFAVWPRLSRDMLQFGFMNIENIIWHLLCLVESLP